MFIWITLICQFFRTSIKTDPDVKVERAGAPKSYGHGFNPRLGPILIHTKIFGVFIRIFVINDHRPSHRLEYGPRHLTIQHYRIMCCAVFPFDSETYPWLFAILCRKHSMKIGIVWKHLAFWKSHGIPSINLKQGAAQAMLK